jgi:hypothetical protein
VARAAASKYSLLRYAAMMNGKPKKKKGKGGKGGK